MEKKQIYKYVKIARPDHWIKQLFILPGMVFAYVLIRSDIDTKLVFNIVFSMLATCFIASSNYVINEWLDAEFDKYHPVKKHRSVVENNLNSVVVYMMYFGLAILGVICAYIVNTPVLYMEIWLWIMGILYNVKPIRTKDIPFVDVLTESINNAIRLLIGWFAITDIYYPPCSIIIGYWFVGAFLMAMKRFSEYRMIGDASLAGLYRKSFKYYTEKSLLGSSFFYAMNANLFVGIFLIKYRIELILFMPFFMGIFCYYFYISFKMDSAVQKPEKIYKEKGLMIYCILICILFILLMFIDIPIINKLLSNALVEI